MQFNKDFYISFGNLNSSKPEQSKGYVFWGDRGVFIIRTKNEDETLFNRRFKLHNYAH